MESDRYRRRVDNDKTMECTCRKVVKTKTKQKPDEIGKVRFGEKAKHAARIVICSLKSRCVDHASLSTRVRLCVCKKENINNQVSSDKQE